MAPHEIDYLPPAPAFSVRRSDGYAIVTISGEIDIARPALREQLIGLLRPGSASRCNVQAAALL
jgi:hypothetical protein